MGKELLSKLDDAIRCIYKSDTSERKREVYAIAMHPGDCFKLWDLSAVPQDPTVVTTYKGYMVVASDKVDEGTVIVI